MKRRRFTLRAALATSAAVLMMAAFCALPGRTLRASQPPGSAAKFDPDGEFPVLGTAPKGLEEVSTIALWGRGRGRFMNVNSGVYTTRGITQRFKTISVSQQRFTFTTVSLRGTSYSFNGRFLRGGVFAELDSEIWDKPILEGTLTKLRNGKKVAEARMQFSYFGGT